MSGILDELRPLKHQKIMDLVAAAGIEVTDWAKFKKGIFPTKAAANPKYCYEWSYVSNQPKVIVLNLWYSNTKTENGRIIQNLNCQELATRVDGPKKKRAFNMDFALQKAHREGLPVRVILLDDESPNGLLADDARRLAERRLLDSAPWAITFYDSTSGECELTRQEHTSLSDPSPSTKLRVGQQYTKSQLYSLFSVPESKQRGNWDTGYTNYGGDWFIFCNVGIPGRTGHDYANKFVGDELHWVGKTASTITNNTIASMLTPTGHIFVFFREEDRDPYTFAGRATAKSYRDLSPVEIIWTFPESSEQRPEVLAEEIVQPDKYIEGSSKTISVNVYERNPHARKVCIDHFGAVCSICGFDFEKVYGELGKGFIHVHHLKQLADIGESYSLNPTEDLRPVCPNCHSMLHRRRPAFSIDEMILHLVNPL